MPEVVALIQIYTRRALPVLAGGPSRFLFPARSGGTKPEAQLSVQLKKAIARHAGLDLNAHAFRHLAAMLFLRRHPGEYETVKLLLGHKSLVTTQIYTHLGRSRLRASFEAAHPRARIRRGG